MLMAMRYLFFLFCSYVLLVFFYNMIRFYKNKNEQRQQMKHKKTLETLFKQGLECKGTKKFIKIEKKLSKHLLHLEYLSCLHTIRLENDLLESYQDLFDNLCCSMLKKDNVTKAYFAYILKVINMKNEASYQFLFKSLETLSFGVVEKVMDTLYEFGEEEKVVRALCYLNHQEFSYHYKLLADGLMKYNGQKKSLATILLRRFNDFIPAYQIAFVIFFRLAKIPCQDELIALLKNKDKDKELRLQSIRYFEVVTDKRVVPILLKLLKEETEFEYAVVITQVLKSYPTKKVASALKGKLADHNYYVRYHSAKSLMAMKDIIKLNDIKDPYGKEMLTYVSKKKEGGQDDCF